MLKIMSGEEAADAATNIAARRASIIFAAEQWTYDDIGFEDGRVADAHKIEAVIRDLLRTLPDDKDEISNGRITIMRDELYGYSIHLHIGTFSEENMEAFNEADFKVLDRILKDTNRHV